MKVIPTKTAGSEKEAKFASVRCPSCRRMICEVADGSQGVLRYKCKKCGRENKIHLQREAEKNSILSEAEKIPV